MLDLVIRHSLLNAANCAMAHVIRPSDVGKHLACLPPCNGFAPVSLPLFQGTRLAVGVVPVTEETIMFRLSDVCFSCRDQGTSGLNAINVRRPLRPPRDG